MAVINQGVCFGSYLTYPVSGFSSDNQIRISKALLTPPKSYKSDRKSFQVRIIPVVQTCGTVFNLGSFYLNDRSPGYFGE